MSQRHWWANGRVKKLTTSEAININYLVWNAGKQLFYNNQNISYLEDYKFLEKKSPDQVADRAA